MIIHKSTESEKEKDFSIIRKILKGNKKAYSQLVLKYQNRVLSLGVSFFRNQEDARDFCQDVMFKAYQALPNFKMQSSFYTWLMTIAYNMAVSSKKKKVHFALSIEDYNFISPCLSPEEKLIKEALKVAIEKAVSSLPEHYKVLIELYFFYDVSYQDMEIITGFPSGTIKSYIFRAKKILKEQLEIEGFNEVPKSRFLPYL